MTAPAARVHCSSPGCDAQIHPRSAHETGWFVPHSGRGSDQKPWCPEHLPDWVAGWREKRQKK